MNINLVNKINPNNKEISSRKKIMSQQKIFNENRTNFFQKSKNSINFNNNPNLNNNYINNNEINNLGIEYNIPESLESSLSSKINEQNLALLNDKIKKQENDIIYLNNRLKNYDICVDQITQLNIEINKLNEIINNKNKTIQEFREIADLSKNKIEELMNNKKELNQKINFLEKENKRLNDLNKYKENNNNYIDKKAYIENIKIEDYNKLKYDLNQIIQENKKLKTKIKEKDEKIENLENFIKKLKKEKKDKINLIYSNIDEKSKIAIQPNNWKKITKNTQKTYSIQERSPTPIITNNYNGRYDLNSKNHFHKKDNSSFRTEPNNSVFMSNNHSKRILANFHNKYNYLKNKYRISPLEYNNYTGDNFKDNINPLY